MHRFLHTSDLHLGKRFGNLPEDIRGRLREARHVVLSRLATEARTAGATAILIAGDMFDTETPTPALMRQALGEMASHGDIAWVILPGNHDSLLADALWSVMGHNLPDNVTVALEAVPLEIVPGMVILPAPCTVRRPGRDLTDWMDAATSGEDIVRIGLAHGAIQSFGEEGAQDIIAPDRAKRAGLDYLALGDWHGQMSIDPRTWYSGTPEPDRFKHGQPGRALLVTIPGPGVQPDVNPVDTGSFDWMTLALDFLGEEDAEAMLRERLPAARRRQTLLRIVASGRLRIGQRSDLENVVVAVAPEFGHLEFRTENLASLCEAEDLDMIDKGGALRQAAEMLRAESADTLRSAQERAVAADAMNRLFAISREVEAL